MKTIILIFILMYNAFCMGQLPNIYHEGIGKITYPERSYPTVQPKQYNDTSDAKVERYYPGALISVKGVIYARNGFLNKWCLLPSENEIKKDTIPLKIIPKTTVGKGLTGKYINDSLMQVMIDSGWATISSGTIFSLVDSVTIWGNEEPVYHRKKDTVKVMLLVCDTSNQITIMDGREMHELIPEKAFYKYGYSVRELHNITEDIFDGNMPDGTLHNRDYDYWRHLYFLTPDKKPLPKNIIVWQSKEIQ